MRNNTRADRREYHRVWYIKNRERCAAKSTAWRKANPEKVKGISRAWYTSLHGRAASRRNGDAWRKRNPVRALLLGIKAKCRRRGIDFNLTEDWFLAHYSQGCEMTGWELDALLPGGYADSPTAPHIDRVRSGGGYTMDNCRVVCAIYNLAKWTFGDAAVLDMAAALMLRKGN